MMNLQYKPLSPESQISLLDSTSQVLAKFHVGGREGMSCVTPEREGCKNLTLVFLWSSPCCVPFPFAGSTFYLYIVKSSDEYDSMPNPVSPDSEPLNRWGVFLGIPDTAVHQFQGTKGEIEDSSPSGSQTSCGEEGNRCLKGLDVQVDDFNVICLIITTINSVSTVFQVQDFFFFFLSEVLKNKKYFAK